MPVLNIDLNISHLIFEIVVYSVFVTGRIVKTNLLRLKEF